MLTFDDTQAQTLSNDDFSFDLSTINGSQGTQGTQGTQGNDTLIDGQGFDILTGGAGRDSFVITKSQGNIDTLTDFNLNEDQIDLRGLDQVIHFCLDAFEDETYIGQFNNKTGYLSAGQRDSQYRA